MLKYIDAALYMFTVCMFTQINIVFSQFLQRMCRDNCPYSQAHDQAFNNKLFM